MGMCDTARKLLAQTCAELSAAKARRDEIGDAITMLVNAGVSNGILDALGTEHVEADTKVRELMIQRFLLRAGMRAHGWLADGE